MLKICGISTVEEAENLADLQVDFFGMIFAKSKRQVDIQTAQKIFEIFKKHNKKVVGVFTDEAQVNEGIKHINFDVIQLHNDFSYEFARSLHVKGFEIWRVFRISDKLPEFNEFSQIIDKKIQNFYPMFDTLGKNLGGNNQSFNHSVLSSLKKNSFVLAGGLNEQNILQAKSYYPYVLDVNSSVESDGKKNRQKVQNIIKILRNGI